MVKIFALLGAALGFILLVLGVALAREHPAMLLLVVAGGPIVFEAFSIDMRREKMAAKMHDEEIKLRI